MKRFAAFLLALMLVFSMTPQVLAQTEVPDTGNYDFDTENPGVDYDDMNVENFTYVIEEGNAVITGYTGIGGYVIIPATLSLYPVTAIGTNAFSDCVTLTSVTIHDGVRNIGSFAFSGCDNLAGIWVSEGNANYASDEKGALLNKDKTELFRVPQAIAGSYTIDSSVQTVAADAFRGCEHLTSVTIPGGVTTLQKSTFTNCGSLTGIWVSEDNAYYSNDASGVLFDKNKTELISAPRKITGSYTIGNSVITIAENAFYDCKDLSVLAIPVSVTAIGDNAFGKCAGLQVVYYAGTQAQWADIDNNRHLLEATVHYNHGPAHSYTTKVTAPTCTDQGYTTYTCTCGDSYKGNYVAATGHSYAEATCTAAKTCKVCGATSGSALGHSWGSWTVTKKATCAATGTKRAVCTRCSTVTTQTVAKLTTHTYSNTCDTTCNVCSAKRTIQHTYTNNCDTTCNVCSAKRTITHTYTNILTKATFTENGKVVRKCAVCGKVASTSYIAYPKTVQLSATSYTYNGKVKTPAVTVKDAEGNTLMKGTDYTVTYSSGRTNAGTYKVVVTMLGNYTGTKTLTFKIKPISISKCTVKLKTTSYTYNGKVRTPLVIAKDAAGNALENGTDYTVTYASGRKNVGQFKVTVKMKGNYSGSKVLTFKILPKAASIKKLTAKSKAFKVSLNTVTSQSTGYQIQYSTSSKFTSAKTVTVNGYKTSSKTISGLKKGKKYYVRVRTFKIVGSAKYYSGWSSYKTVKTK